MILVHTGTARSASTWMEGILLALCEELPLRCEARGPDSYRERIATRRFQDGTVHPAVFLPWHELALEHCPHPWRVFHVRRDPRDALVSGYYSNAYSHVSNPVIDRRRPYLLAHSREDGLLWLMEQRHADAIEILLSHLGRGVADGCLSVEFADLIARPQACIQALLDFADLRIPERTLRDLVEARSFERLSGGRTPGQEDILNHYRKGVVGDWTTHFTPRVKEAYKERFGKALVELGYERSLVW